MRYDTRRYWCGGLSPPARVRVRQRGADGEHGNIPVVLDGVWLVPPDAASAATLRLSSRISSSRISSSRISSSLTAHRNARQPSSASSQQDSRPEPHAHISRPSPVPGATSSPGRDVDADIPRTLASSAIARRRYPPALGEVQQRHVRAEGFEVSQTRVAHPRAPQTKVRRRAPVVVARPALSRPVLLLRFPAGRASTASACLGTSGSPGAGCPRRTSRGLATSSISADARGEDPRRRPRRRIPTGRATRGSGIGELRRGFRRAPVDVDRAVAGARERRRSSADARELRGSGTAARRTPAGTGIATTEARTRSPNFRASRSRVSPGAPASETRD